MRPLIATACACLLACSVTPVPQAAAGSMRAPDELLRTANRLSPPDDTFDPLPLAATQARPLDDTAGAPIDIPAQKGASALPTPRDMPPPAATAKPKPVVHRSTQEVCDTVTRAAQRNNLPVPFFIRLLFQESKFKPGVVSRAGAQGIAQFMPQTADAVGLDNPFDPLEAIPASARLLRDLFEQFGNLGLAAAAYNAGPKRIHDWLARKGKLPDETQGYVKTITGRPAERWKTADAGTPAIKLPPRAPCQDAAGLLASSGPNEIPVPLEAPRRADRIAKVEKKTSLIAAAHQHRGHTGDTVNLAARRKAGHTGRRAHGHHVASARP